MFVYLLRILFAKPEINRPDVFAEPPVSHSTDCQPWTRNWEKRWLFSLGNGALENGGKYPVISRAIIIVLAFSTCLIFFFFFTEGADEPDTGPNTDEVSDAGQFVLSHTF